MKEFIPNIITGVCTLMGALGGVYWTQKGNKNMLEQQIIRDEIKEKRNELKDTLEVYNKILKIDGENTVVIESDDKIEEFDLNVYQNEVRPILFEKYHLLHDEVAQIVAYMDVSIKTCKFFGEIGDIHHIGLCKDYNDLIRNIRKNIHEFRKEVSKVEMS
ncbi:hypothetical protein MHH74_06085 [Bacillus sp. FSL M7-0996]|uniref:hypothetical protein n=1 Tax=Bacillus sp. FSL M7-0996 TaxID=2921538 RepID=UPI0030FB94AE